MFGATILVLVFFASSMGAGIKIGRELEKEEHECPKIEVIPTHEGNIGGEPKKKHECND